MNNLYTVNTLNANDQVVIWQGENSNFASIPQSEFLQGVKDQIDFTMLENQIGDVRNDVNDLTDRVDLISTHNELNGRSAADAHPIEAISGLQSALDNKVSIGAEDQTIAGTKSFNVLTAVDGSGINKINASNIETGKISNDRLDTASQNTYGITRIATALESVDFSNNSVVISPSTFKTCLDASGNAPIYANRAWANVNGASLTINASKNIGSFTKSGNIYRLTFSTPMPTDKYSFSFGWSTQGSGAACSVAMTSQTAAYIEFIATYGGDNTAGSYQPTTITLSVTC